jgi:hypothetical protein
LSRVLVLTRVLIVGFLVGILPVTLDLGKGNAFPAVKVIGLFFTINPLIFLVLLNNVFTAGATRQMLRGSRSNVLLHDARKLSSLSSLESDLMIFLLDLFFLRGTVTASLHFGDGAAAPLFVCAFCRRSNRHGKIIVVGVAAHR